MSLLSIVLAMTLPFTAPAYEVPVDDKKAEAEILFHSGTFEIRDAMVKFFAAEME